MKKLNNQIDFFLNEFGRDIIMKGNAKKVILSDASTKPSFFDDKYIRMKEAYGTGNILEYQSAKWMVVSQVVADNNTYKAKIRRADWQISFYIQNVIQKFYCIVDNMEATIEEGKIISTVAGEIKLIFQATDNTNSLAIDRRFIKFGSAWKITGIDKSKSGLIIIYAKKDLFIDKDDKDNEIADRWSYEEKHVYSITITNNNPMTLEIGETRKLNYMVYDNGTAMQTLPAITFATDNAAVATIDSTGNMTAVAEGTTKVYCMLKDSTSIKAECTLNVVKVVVKVYSITLTYSSANIYLGGSARTFTAKVYYGDTQITDKTVLWSVQNTDGTVINKVTLTDKKNNSCTIAAGENYDYIGQSVILRAYLSDDSNIKNEVTLKLTVY